MSESLASPVHTDSQSVRRELMVMARSEALTVRQRMVIGAALGHIGTDAKKTAALTGAQVMRVYENSPFIKGSMTFAAFERVLRLVEGVHRIERAD